MCGIRIRIIIIIIIIIKEIGLKVLSINKGSSIKFLPSLVSLVVQALF